MRIVLIGVSHWHTPFYLDPTLALPHVAVAGVSDPDLGRAQQVAVRSGSSAWRDYRAMCAEAAPDFAFVLGRHCDMAETGRFLIDARIPFVIEKPCGITAAEVWDLAERAAAAGIFVAVPLVFRQSPLLDAIRDAAAGEAVRVASFKFIGGMVDRYREARCDWMLSRATAGGGALINLGVHFLDLCRVLLPDARLAVSGASLSSAAGLDIDDHAMVLLRGGSAACMVETGYLYPAPNSVFDLHYSIRTERHYIAVRDPGSVEIVDMRRRRRVLAMPTINAPLYPGFVADVLRRVERGEPPVAGLAEMAAAMELVEAADRASPLPSGEPGHGGPAGSDAF